MQMRIRKKVSPDPDEDDRVSLDVHINGVKLKARGSAVFKLLALALSVLVGYEYIM